MTGVQKWVKALRSGEYSQTVGRLADSYGYCCLGVACEVAVKEGIIDSYNPDDIGLPSTVQEWLGISTREGAFELATEGSALTICNDRLNYNFEQIADVIEERPKGLFT